MGDETTQAPLSGGEAPSRSPLEEAAANDQPIGAAPQPSAEELLKQAEQKSAEHYDAWLRAKAENDNLRKRAELDIANARKYAVEGFSSELLAVKDALEAALATESATPEALKSGVELTLKQLRAAFDKYKISEINPVGEKFDPHRHQAISMVESDAAPNTVVMVLQKGYLLNERVLRPAMVMVAKAKSQPESGEPSA